MVKTYNPIYRVSEVADAVYNLMNSGKLPYLVLNGAKKVRGTDLEKFIESYPTESVGGEEK